MPYFKFQNIKISAISAAVPKGEIKSDEYAERFGEEYVAKFKDGTGVLAAHKTREYQTASDLAYAAAEDLLHKKQINREEIGALIFCTSSPDYRRPASACVLHKRLGLSKNCTAYDINLTCSAFVFGLTSICSLMQSSDINKALLLLGETSSKMANPQDKSIVMLFGDGGAALLLEKTDESNVIHSILKTDGTGYQQIIAPGGGFRNLNPSKHEFEFEDGNIRSMYNVYMQGENVFSFTISEVPRTVKEFLAKTETSVDGYDCFAFHQANRFILQMIAKKLKVDFGRFPLCLDRYGNTSGPSVPITICDHYGKDGSNQEVNILMSSFGVGLSWGVCSAVVNVNDIYPIIETDEIFKEGIINSPDDFLREE